MPSDLWLVVLFTIATAVAIAARRLRLPYTVALVVAGLALGATRIIVPPVLGRALLYSVFLPGLLFEAAYPLKLDELRGTKLRILALAVPGVLVGMFVTAGLLRFAGRVDASATLPFGYGLVFAATIAATDPIAVVALFKEVGAPRTLTVLIEGESLLNDGTAIVLFSVALTFVTGGHASWVGGVIYFVRVVSIGVAVGAAIGVAVALVIKRVDDTMIEIALTTIAAYGSFAIAEHAHGSGVLATVAAGLICGNFTARVAMNERTRSAVAAFWTYVAFALNSVVFLLVGFTANARLSRVYWKPIVVAFLVSLVARAVVVHVVTLASRRTRERMPWSWSLVLTWGGLRGALSMVLAIGLPEGFPYRDPIVAMTFGVVVLSLLVQGLTLSSLLRRCRLDDSDALARARIDS